MREINGTKIQEVYYGVVGMPYPTVTPDNRIVNLENDNLSVTQEQSASRFLTGHENPNVPFGMLYRDMPIPSMLRAWHTVLDGTRIQSDGSTGRTAFMLIGDPGYGKTYMAKKIGQITHPEGPMVVECGDKDLRTLLYRYEVAAQDTRKLHDILDSRLKDGSLSVVSKNLLTEVVGTKGDRFNWEKLKASDNNTLSTVILEERLNQSQNGVSLISKEGELIQAWKAGRPIVLDEFTKAQVESLGSLNGLLSFLTDPSIDETTVNDDSGNHFTFRRSEQNPLFNVIMTGNHADDSAGTHYLPDSVRSRVTPLEFQALDAQDWEHRFSQLTMGVPASTIRRMMPEDLYLDGAFTDLLQQMRQVGLNEQQSANIPHWQEEFISIAPQVIEAGEKVATFYQHAKRFFDPNVQHGKDDRFAPDNMAKTALRTMRSPTTVDMRLMAEHILQAVRDAAQPIKSDFSAGFGQLSAIVAPEPAAPEEEFTKKFGSNLSRVVGDWIAQFPDAIQAHLLNIAQTTGVIEPEKSEAGQNQNFRTIAQLLDAKCATVGTQSSEDEILRSLQAALLRQAKELDPKLNISRPNEVLPLAAIKTALEAAQNDRAATTDKFTSALILPNIEAYLEAADGQQVPIVKVVPTWDPYPTPAEQEKSQYLRAIPSEKDLASLETVLRTLTWPEIGRQNLEHFWSRGAIDYSSASNSGALFTGSKVPSLEKQGYIAQNHEEADMAITAIKCATKDGGTQVVTILRLKTANETYIIGDEEIKPILSNQLEGVGIHYAKYGVRTDAIAELIETRMAEVWEHNHEYDDADFDDDKNALWAALGLRVEAIENRTRRGDDRVAQLLHEGPKEHHALHIPSVFFEREGR